MAGRAARAPGRLTERPFPPYAYRPGRNPHPRRHPEGHSYGRPEPRPRTFAARAWRASPDYAFALDLFHAGFWWESHELFEGLWNAFGRHTAEGRLCKALVLLAAAELKRALGSHAASQRLARRARRELRELPPWVLGVHVAKLDVAVGACFGPTGEPPLRLPLGADVLQPPDSR